MRFPFETISLCAPRPSRRDLPFRAVVSLCATVSHYDKRWIRALHAGPATSHASRHAPCNPALFTLEVYDPTPFRVPILRVATSCPIHFTPRSLQSRVVHVATLRPPFVTYINASQRALNHCGTPHCGMCRNFWTNRQGSRMPEHQSKSCTKVFPGKMPGRNDAGKTEWPRATQSGRRFADNFRQT